MSSRRTTLLVVLGMVAAHPYVLQVWPGPLRMFVVTAAITLLPGVAWQWCWTRPSRIWGAALGRHLVLSTIALAFVLVVLALARIAPTAMSLWTSLCALTLLGSAGAWAADRRGTRFPARRRRLPGPAYTLALATFAGSLVVFSRMAVSVVPPMVDHDMDMQGPGYALLTTLTPRAINDRGLTHYFAHPPLLHVYVAASIVLHGEVDTLRAYDTITVASSGVADATSVAATYAHYERAPLLRETRAPNVVFGAAAVALVALLAARRSRRWWFGALVAATYAANPEVLVRSSYGGYFAISTLAALLMLVRHDHAARSRGVIWTGVWAALANHKLVLLPASLPGGMRLTTDSWRDAWLRTRGIVLAFVAGSAVFWVWGLFVAPGDFITDHFRHHLIDRLAHDNPLGYSGYLSMTGLWREFGQHTGFLLMPVALACALSDLRRLPAGRDRRFTALLLAWALATAVVFTVVDWRMTKHISPLLASLPLLLTPPRHAARWRVAIAVATCLWSLAWYTRDIATLLTAFGEFGITPDW